MRTPRYIEAVGQPAKRLRIEDHLTAEARDSGYPGVHIAIISVSGTHPPAVGVAIDPAELARQLDGIVPGFHASYREPVQEEAQLDAEQIEQLILMLKSNGYDVVKQADPGAEYVNGLLQFASQIPTTTDAGKLASQGAHEILDWAERAAEQAGSNDLRDVEVYVEIDRAMLVNEFSHAVETHEYGPGAPGSGLWTHLWPVVARIDENDDVILHVTSGDRAQGGASARGL